MEILEIKPIYDNWESLINDLKREDDKNRFIYRGQTNSFNFKTNKLYPWEIISSFDRCYPTNTYRFRNFLNQHLKQSIFEKVYQDYSFAFAKNLSYVSQIEKIYFLQHYGVPTCFI